MFCFILYSPTGRKFRSRNDLATYFGKEGIVDLSAEEFDFSVRGKRSVKNSSPKKNKSISPKKKVNKSPEKPKDVSRSLKKITDLSKSPKKHKLVKRDSDISKKVKTLKKKTLLVKHKSLSSLQKKRMKKNAAVKSMSAGKLIVKMTFPSLKRKSEDMLPKHASPPKMTKTDEGNIVSSPCILNGHSPKLYSARKISLSSAKVRSEVVLPKRTNEEIFSSKSPDKLKNAEQSPIKTPTKNIKKCIPEIVITAPSPKGSPRKEIVQKSSQKQQPKKHASPSKKGTKSSPKLQSDLKPEKSQDHARSLLKDHSCSPRSPRGHTHGDGTLSGSKNDFNSNLSPKLEVVLYRSCSKGVVDSSSDLICMQNSPDYEVPKEREQMKTLSSKMSVVLENLDETKYVKVVLSKVICERKNKGEDSEIKKSEQCIEKEFLSTNQESPTKDFVAQNADKAKCMKVVLSKVYDGKKNEGNGSEIQKSFSCREKKFLSENQNIQNENLLPQAQQVQVDHSNEQSVNIDERKKQETSSSGKKKLYISLQMSPQSQTERKAAILENPKHSPPFTKKVLSVSLEPSPENQKFAIKNMKTKLSLDKTSQSKENVVIVEENWSPQVSVSGNIERKDVSCRGKRNSALDEISLNESPVKKRRLSILLESVKKDQC